MPGHGDLHDATAAHLDQLIGTNPGLRDALADLHAAAVAAVDRRLVELCEWRASLLIGVDPPVVDPPVGACEHACVDLVEQSVIDVAGVTDAQVAALAEQLGPDGAATFVTAALVIEQRLRMRAMWERLGLVAAP